MKYIYLAGPISKYVFDNHVALSVDKRLALISFMQNAADISDKLVRDGWTVISPYASALRTTIVKSQTYWYENDQNILLLLAHAKTIPTCTEVAILMLPGWQESAGAYGEMQLARRLGLNVYVIGKLGEMELAND